MGLVKNLCSMKVCIAGVEFKNPVIAASGTYGFGKEYTALYPLSTLGGISLKGLTLEPREGNPPPRVAETPSGMINSVGLQNPGVDKFISEELAAIRQEDIVVIANVAGSTVEDYIAMAEKIDVDGIDMVELNISCPNVKHGGAAFGVDCVSAAEVTREFKRRCKKPLMVKLTPNVTDITEVAKAVEAAGADALSLINTVLGMRIDIKTARPIVKNNVGGLSGPCVFPIAVRMVWQVARAVNIPIVGLGGICTAQDAIEMMMAGATAIQVGSAMFSNPLAPIHIINGIQKHLSEQNISSVTQLTGSVLAW